MPTLAKELTVFFGLGKSLRNRETCVIPAGTEILSRFNKDGFHKFVIKEFGRDATYAVASEKILDAVLDTNSLRC